ncbi:hypothetical protein RRF57_005648 [Xylaria bambusicola]|uniref:Uncharacterized protein n=1 Tax=Xylaria bambusicola TaxID=326684 RepID=A0AAN7Z872_9PEZI
MAQYNTPYHHNHESKKVCATPPPVSDDVKDAAMKEAEAAAAGVHSSGQEPGMQWRSAPQGPEAKNKSEIGDEAGKEPKHVAKDAT